MVRIEQRAEGGSSKVRTAEEGGSVRIEQWAEGRSGKD